MRPLRLYLDGFGSYREPAEADFTGVDFFALVGPTGSGKSTVIDGLCFALYGTVPRWGKENVIAQALAPAANACRVALVFEASGKRYGAVRALARNARGQVHTKEARLELLSGDVPSDAPLADLLEASVEPIAEGPDQVKAAVQDLLGLTYEHFTQSVLLPQGRFSEFLHAKASDRQNLLVELLAFGVYDTVGQKARERAKLAAERAQQVKGVIAELAGATAEAEAVAAARVTELAGVAAEVLDLLTSLRQSREQAADAAARSEAVRAQAGLLAAVRTPAEVPGLARRISDADKLLAERRAHRDGCDQAETDAGLAREALGEVSRMERIRAGYAEQRELAALLVRNSQARDGRLAGRSEQEAALAAAEKRLQHAQDALAAAQRAHAAVAVAADLRVGEDCPVCLQPVKSLPHHAEPADLTDSRAAVDWATKAVRQARSDHDRAATAVAVAERDVEETRKQIERVAVALTGAPDEAEAIASLDAIIAAEHRLAEAREAAVAARQAATAADRKRSALDAEERHARARLGTVRDSVVQFGAPATDGSDLAADWQKLTVWAKTQEDERNLRLPALATEAGLARREVAGAETTITSLLAGHGIGDVLDPARAEAAVAAHRERAKHQLEQVRAGRRKAAELEVQLRVHAEEEQVASMLGRLLRATSFERWLCGEALDSLVAEASETLMELSGGQYELDRDERNDLVVIDYQDAGATRPVHTLSGGETFQASLALALALSRQVIGLSAGMRDLNSMFLDEGFGTLDEDTLSVVGDTLERLSAGSDRMIGIITHVPALAERAPVRFVVSRAGMTSTLRKEVVT